MTTFEVSGPHEIPVDRLPNADRVTDDESKKKQFFSNVPHEGGDAIGCYIFAMRTGGGTDPWYVGMTTRGFCKECFQATKTEKYNKIGHSPVRGPNFSIERGHQELFSRNHPDRVPGD